MNNNDAFTSTNVDISNIEYHNLNIQICNSPLVEKGNLIIFNYILLFLFL